MKGSIRFRWHLAVAVMVGGLLISISMAHAQSSANYTIVIDVLSGGGGPEGSASYDLDSVLGQSSAIGVSTECSLYQPCRFLECNPGAGALYSRICFQGRWMQRQDALLQYLAECDGLI